MFEATLFALAAAGLHAAWNLVAKRSTDRFVALWGQFVASALIGAAVILLTRDLPAEAWIRAAVTGLIHIPYLVLLAVAYTRGDFSVAYPVARGSGAVLAGFGGIVLLGDQLSALGIVAVVTVGTGMWLLSIGAAALEIGVAVLIGVAIGAYTVNDSDAVREYGVTYPFATFIASGIAVSAYGIATGRTGNVVASLRRDWNVYLWTGAMTVGAYTLVLVAVRRAPVGYVTALRESSVLVAAFLGTTYLAEGRLRQRILGAGVILGGLVLLVAAR